MHSLLGRGLLAAVLLAAAAPALADAKADAQAGAQAGALPPERQAALLHLLRQDCGACHGMTLKGGLGTPLLPADLAGKAPDALADVVLDGVPGTPMPPWRALLTAGEARWMIDRLREGLDR